MESMECRCGNKNKKQFQNFGKTASGKQRYRCINSDCKKTLIAPQSRSKSPVSSLTCPRCKATAGRRAGRAGGRQVYQCKACKTRFVQSPRRPGPVPAPLDTKFMIRVANAVMGKGQTFKETAKNLHIPARLVSKLFWHFTSDDDYARRLSPVALEVYEDSNVGNLTKRGISLFLKRNALTAAKNRIKKEKDQALAAKKLAFLEPLLNHYSVLSI